jgi:cytochrome b561
MPIRETVITYYSLPMRLIHWLTAILVLVAFIYGPGGSEQRIYSAARDFDRQLHETLGICVFVLLVVRIGWRVFDKHPKSPPVARWMSVAASVVQAALYILLFAVPLTAVSGAWLEGHALTLLGGVVIPAPVAESHALGATIAKIHTWLGDAILWLAGVHACAALFHHFVLKDNVLWSMLLRRNSSTL